MTIKHLIVDPSFFVRKNGLSKIPRLEEKIVRVKIEKTVRLVEERFGRV